MTVHPIRPEDVVGGGPLDMPDVVIETWNRLVAGHFNGTVSTVLQTEAAQAVAEAAGVERQVVFDSGWLDVEPIYRRAGWAVGYDRPGYNESYPAKFTFRKGDRK